MGNRQALIDTLAYSNIFLSPLSKDELYYFLHTDRAISRDVFELLLKNPPKEVVVKKGYVSLVGQGKIIDHRIKNQRFYNDKLIIARNAARILSLLPSVYFIGLTGSVAAGNPRDDDIDLFIVAKDDALFVTRVFAICLLSLLGKRRRRNEVNVRNKICLNMFCDTAGMGDFGKRKNIYVAREIAQMIPLFSREKCYKDFLEKNKWVRKYIAHVGIRFEPFVIKKRSSLDSVLNFLEPLARYVSRRSITRHSGDGDKSSHALFFYPSERQNSILHRYKAAGGLL